MSISGRHTRCLTLLISNTMVNTIPPSTRMATLTLKLGSSHKVIPLKRSGLQLHQPNQSPILELSLLGRQHFAMCPIALPPMMTSYHASVA